ncbi:MAG TPA: hypothetical protein VML75_12935 [Kofleriaceae bacterium]|nr:hypothetical protein [Kofleriaceae bacterium]
MKHLTWITTVLVALAAGCGGDSKNDAPPRLIAGGGIGDGAIEGVVNVYVIDGDTDAAISGAEVIIGEAGEDPLILSTDGAGLAAFDDGSLAGPTTVTVKADGYIVATWFGANGANVTVPMTPVVESSDVPRATVRGSIVGWENMDAPAANHFVVGIVSYSHTHELGDAANELTQPAGDPIPPNACAVAVAPIQPCSWSLVTRTGTVAIFATIIDIDTKGTQDERDDTSEVIGYAYKTGIQVEDGITMSNVMLAQLPAGSLTEVGASYASLPSGLDTAASLLRLDLGDSGVMPLGFMTTAGPETVTIPDLAGAFAANTYQAIAFAGDSNADPDDDENPMTAIILRDLGTLGAEVEFGAWMDQPANLAYDGSAYSFTPVNSATLHTAKLRRTNGTVLWNIALIDGRSSFVLPAISPDPLPAGELELIVDTLEGAIDLEDFAIDELVESFERVSKSRRAITR